EARGERVRAGRFDGNSGFANGLIVRSTGRLRRCGRLAQGPCCRLGALVTCLSNDSLGPTRVMPAKPGALSEHLGVRPATMNSEKARVGAVRGICARGVRR